MAKGGAAFGTGPAVEGLIPPTLPTPEQGIDDLHRIAEKYDIPALFQPRTFNLTAGYMAQKFDFFQSQVNAISITAITGLVYVYIGDYSGGTLVLPQLPHFVVSAAIAPQTLIIPLPLSEKYTITVQEGANATATGCLSAMGL